jgi:hypothetical protein
MLADTTPSPGLAPSLVSCLCVGAGDWQAASLALEHLSKDVQHHQQLLAARQERANSKADAAGDKDSTEGNAPADGQKQALQDSSSISLRQELQLQGAERCAALARSAADAVESVRYGSAPSPPRLSCVVLFCPTVCRGPAYWHRVKANVYKITTCSPTSML